MKILITGSAGFIGFHLAKKLSQDHMILGIDNLNNYYDQSLKDSRISILKTFDNFSFVQADITDYENLLTINRNFDPDIIIHLAAQAGVRFSVSNPQEYVNSNLVGHSNILEISRQLNIKHLFYASSSSVYGNSKQLPYKESSTELNPESFYAATKICCEVLTESYKNLYSLGSTGLRFFSVYGPWGRPDMAYYIFTKKIVNNESIDIFGDGSFSRDMTYIDDVISGICELIEARSMSSSSHEIYNIGNSQPITLIEMLRIIENKLGLKAKINFLEQQIGDVDTTFADSSKISSLTSFTSKISPDEGLKLFVEWYKKEAKI